MSPAFFTDRDLGKKFPSILSAAGISVERHEAHFLHNTADSDWLRVIGERGWIAITHDQRIRYRPNELAAVMNYRVSMLVVIGKVPLPVLARAFVATLPSIAEFVAHHAPPYVAKVYRPSSPDSESALKPGRVELWHPKPE